MTSEARYISSLRAARSFRLVFFCFRAGRCKVHRVRVIIVHCSGIRGVGVCDEFICDFVSFLFRRLTFENVVR